MRISGVEYLVSRKEPTAHLPPVDFHSFRRAFNTALADAGVSIQTAMRLAGPADAATHM